MQNLKQFRIMEIEGSRLAIIAAGDKLVQALTAFKATGSGTAFNALQRAMREYNGRIAVFNCDLDAAKDDIDEYIGSKLPAWQDSEVAKPYERWKGELERAKLGIIEIADQPHRLNLHAGWIISKSEHLEMPPIRLENFSASLA